ncbi:hypothetical protein KJ671_01450, partial [Patescibacteria group bacterium]|nr:hypothetical protein [Patescibacteria group bacterium]
TQTKYKEGKMKKNTVVKRDMKISEKELKELGWKDTNRTYADSKIFENGKQEFLWDPKTEIVGFMYELC